MDTNIAAWMIAGGPRIEIRADEREREQLRVLLESRRVDPAPRAGLVDRLRSFARPAAAEKNPACCPA